MQEKLKRYLELKKEIKKLKNQPIGNRIRKNGNLENRIKEVYKNERAEQILTRTEEYNYKEYESISEEYHDLRKELINARIVTYNNEGREVITI